MTRVYLADATPEQLAALRLKLLNLEMEVVGDAADWATTLAQAPGLHTDLLRIDWGLLPDSEEKLLKQLRNPIPSAGVNRGIFSGNLLK